jgi:hypothetical protein
MLSGFKNRVLTFAVKQKCKRFMEALKQILSKFPQGFMAGLILNGSLITIAYLIVWKKFKKRFQNWRIQLKERVDAKQIKTELDKAFYTGEHPDVARDFSNLGVAYHSKGDFHMAVKCYRECLSIIEKFFPKDHPHIQTTKENLTVALASITKEDHF